MSLCVSPRLPACGPRPCLECVHASEYELMSTCLPMSAPFPIDSFMEICVPLCVCPSHPTCGPTLWLECVHASVHEFMSTWLPMSGTALMHSLMSSWVPLYGSVFVSQVFMSTLLPILAQPPMDSYIESWVPLHVTVCVSKSACVWSNTLFRMCTCISTCNYVHLTAQVWSRSYE